MTESVDIETPAPPPPSRPLDYFVFLLEKVLATYVQAFAGLLLAGPALDLSAAQSASIAALPAAITVIANGLPLVPSGLPFYVDLLLRTVRTYVAVFLGLLVAVPVFRLDIGIAAAAATGALPAALAVLKAALAQRIGDPGTAAVLPRHRDVSSQAAAA